MLVRAEIQRATVADGNSAVSIKRLIDRVKTKCNLIDDCCTFIGALRIQTDEPIARKSELRLVFRGLGSLQ